MTVDSKLDRSVCQMAESKSLENSSNEKRRGYLSWDEYFMSIVLLTNNNKVTKCTENAKNSTLLLNSSKIIIGMAPKTFNNNQNAENHAIIEAIEEAGVRGLTPKTIFTQSFPCGTCAENIVQAGVTEVVYFNSETGECAARILDEAQIKYRKFQTEKSRILLDFAQFGG